MEDGKKKEQMEGMYDRIKFLFTYNGIANINLNPSYKIGESQ